MDLAIQNAVIDDSERLMNVGIHNGLICTIQEAPVYCADKNIDAAGGLISPPFIEPHFHLDKSNLWKIKPNKSGSLREAIDLYNLVRSDDKLYDLDSRAEATIRLAVQNGIQTLRSHVDIDDEKSLLILDKLISIKKYFVKLIDIQLVAFPQNGLVRNQTAIDNMWKAIEKGCNLVGGMPHGEKNLEDAARHIEICFKIARHYDVDIDMHIDETDDPYWNSLEILAEQTIDNEMTSRVTAGHCCSMAAWDSSQVSRVIEKLKRANISIITNPPVNLVLQGRNDPPPVRRGLTLVKELINAGINILCGQDDMYDMFYPFGRMDPVETMSFTAHAAHMTSEEEITQVFNMPRYNAARALQIDNYGLKINSPANVIVFTQSNPVDIIRFQQPRRFVIRHGHLLVENLHSTIWHDKD